MPEQASWTIVGDVPPWIAGIENELSDIIDSELSRTLYITSRLHSVVVLEI
jgi:hypothetical protein